MTAPFEKAGLTLDAIAQNTARIALTAKKVVGTANDFVEVDDNPTQLSAMKYATDLMGVGKGEESATMNFFQFIQSQKNEYGTR